MIVSTNQLAQIRDILDRLSFCVGIALRRQYADVIIGDLCSSRLMRLTLKLEDGSIIDVISVYAPTIDSEDRLKDTFFANLFTLIGPSISV